MREIVEEHASVKIEPNIIAENIISNKFKHVKVIADLEKDTGQLSKIMIFKEGKLLAKFSDILIVRVRSGMNDNILRFAGFVITIKSSYPSTDWKDNSSSSSSASWTNGNTIWY